MILDVDSHRVLLTKLIISNYVITLDVKNLHGGGGECTDIPFRRTPSLDDLVIYFPVVLRSPV